jgi:hypothetical protein
MLKKAWVLLYTRLETFMWWFGGLRRPDIGDRRRERVAGERRERGSGFYYDVNASMVHRCS